MSDTPRPGETVGQYLDRLRQGDRPGRIVYYDRAGQPLTFGQWVDLAEQGESYRKVDGADVTARDGTVYYVSTVWLGLDMAAPFGDTPAIFETMAFSTGPGEGPWDLFCQRYATEADARAGHLSVCSLIESGVEP